MKEGTIKERYLGGEIARLGKRLKIQRLQLRKYQVDMFPAIHAANAESAKQKRDNLNLKAQIEKLQVENKRVREENSSLRIQLYAYTGQL